jgi:molybdate/tungstate transport system ATP-binding protein
MIALQDISVRAGKFAIERLSFTVATGEYVVLMGKTGSGKTTLLEAICGLKPVQAGSIRLFDRDVTHCKPAERGVAYVPQDRALFPSMTVRDHLAFAMMIRRWERRRIGARVAELADLLGVAHLLDRKPAGLSGGEAQRVALGRALAAEPRVLLLDEPLSALDDETRSEMFLLLEAIKKRTAVTTLHVTHNQAEARHLADRLLLLKDGAIGEVAFPRDGKDSTAQTNKAMRVRP